MAELAAFYGTRAPQPYHAYRVNYEIKQGNSYAALYKYLEKKKALLRQDDSTYLLLDWQSIGQLDLDLRNCVEWDDRICVQHLEQPIKMLAKNMDEVLDWLDRYVNGPYAATNRGFLGANALLTIATGLGRPNAAGTILGGIGKPRR
jgi:hypothetical protein